MTETTTVTISSAVTQPGIAITWYPTIPSSTTTVTAYFLTPTPVVSTATVTEVAFLLENSAGSIFATLTTLLPTLGSSTTPMVFVAPIESHGWNSWSEAAKGGLIAGAVVATLLIVAGLVFWMMKKRRRSFWWTYPEQQIVYSGHPVVQEEYWGPGRFGWGVYN